MRPIVNLRHAGIALIALGMTMAMTEAASAQAAGYCDRYATDYANSYADPGGSAVRGGIGGALFGAGIGALVDGGRGAGRGAIIGGGVGTFAGVANASGAWRRAYDHAYGDCMATRASYDGGRSHRYDGGRAYRAAAPTPGTPEWYDYCSAKYRSFKPETGYYKGYDGKFHLCR